MAGPFLRNDLLACAGLTTLICIFAFLVWPRPGDAIPAHAADSQPAHAIARPASPNRVGVNPNAFASAPSPAAAVDAPPKPSAYGEAFLPAPLPAAKGPSPEIGDFEGKPYPSVSPAVMAENLISAPPPSYPLLARLAHVRGEVTVQALISSNGSVAQARAVEGHHLLRAAALAEVRRRRYRPYRVDGEPANVSTLIKVDFSPQG